MISSTEKFKGSERKCIATGKVLSKSELVDKWTEIKIQKAHEEEDVLAKQWESCVAEFVTESAKDADEKGGA